MSILSLNRRQTAQVVRLSAHVGALIPLALILIDTFMARLGSEPIREITLRTGFAALLLLLVSLAITPFNIVFGWSWAVPARRTIGLYAFLYVVLHFGIFLWLDYALDLALILEATFEKNYALVGFVAFALLIPLAITSNRWSMKELGKNWKRLHRLAYVIGILAVVHFTWLVKNVYTRPLIAAAILALLLLIRYTPIRRRIAGWRRKQKARRKLQRSAERD